MFNDPDPREAGLILQGIGLALIIVYAVTVTSVSLPLAPLQPQWIERVGGSLRGGASFPLVGAGLMVVAEMLDPGSWRLARRVGRIRRLAIWAALGFLMLIPLQSAAGVNVLVKQKRQDLAVVKTMEDVFEEIRLADDEVSLKQAIARVPGAPPTLPQHFRDPLPKVKEQLLGELNPQLQNLNQSFEIQQGKRWRTWTQGTLKDALVNLLFAMAFLVVAQPSFIGRFLWDAESMEQTPAQSQNLEGPTGEANPLSPRPTSGPAAPKGGQLPPSDQPGAGD